MTEDQESELDEGVPTEDTEADGDSTESTDDEPSGLAEGEFVKLAYTAFTVEGDQLVDTTDPEVAEAEGVDDSNQEFEPRTIVLGEGHIFDDVEEAILGSEIGDEGTVTIDAVDAFGEHNPDNVETVSVEKISEDDRYPGAHVHIDGQHGYISTIIGGRARVDFNHPLAGEDVEYEYEILDVVDDREERAAGLIEMYLDISPDLWIQTDEVEEEVLVEPDEDDEDAADDDEADGDDDDAVDDDTDEDEPAEPEYETQTVEKETLYIEATPQMTMNQQWMMGKQQIAQDLMGKVDVDRVIVQEVIEGMGAMGMPGMMGGGMGGADMEAALEDADVDVDEIVEELQDE